LVRRYGVHRLRHERTYPFFSRLLDALDVPSAPTAQYESASERIARAGLSDRVTLLFEDYRELRGTFDKLISIEMIEAVGHAYLDTYFRTCSERLVPGGRMALQAIVIAEQFYESARRTVDFIKRYVFPGGHLPSVGAIANSVARATDLRFVGLEDLTPHYGETLGRWCERFLAKRDDLRALGYDEPLLRLWEFYLRYCEGGFEARHIGLLQLVLDKPACRTPVPAAPPVADVCGVRR
jgi:cyclopropane-fatty-acyl-phospholipid synthase